MTGNFNSVQSKYSYDLVLLKADGNPDVSLDLTTSSGVRCAAVQADGQMVLGGNFSQVNSSTRRGLARIARYGPTEPAFNPNIQGGEVRNILLLENGKMLVAGTFTSVGGVTRTGIARLHQDGSLDPSFDASVGGSVNAVALEPDGSILIGGAFTSVRSTPRNNLARIDGSGALDATFNPNPSAAVSVLVIQPDGRILAGGDFQSTGGGSARGYARLLHGGTLDSSPALALDASVNSIALQADGRILLAGSFTQVAGQSRPQVARLNPDGSLDSGFTFAGANAAVNGISLQGDGSILIGGAFTSASPFARTSLARLFNDPATAAFEMTGPSSLRWLRGGSAPDASRVYFETSSNGYEWTHLANATRTAGGWEASGLDLAGGNFVRARALVAGGMYNGSSGLVESQSLLVPLNHLEEWRLARFGTAANAGQAADGADADNDGIANLLEYATGGDPWIPGTNPVALQQGALFHLTYPRSTAAVEHGTQFVVEWSDQLGIWSTDGITETVIGGTAELPLIRASIPQDGSWKRFARLRVLAP
ncbi:delta-60 repeat domain-containing protein [Haloferula sp. BvORR071]|uniref:delta-60 repeat domain-containing protein n=1 Tax=Haloferula sp. BvORR071 TaxID=1396141 RepID=UPI00054FE25D|nr:delta-60 repeat domain-containing protein [Haloferula sp. BvORR071]